MGVLRDFTHFQRSFMMVLSVVDMAVGQNQ